MLTFELLAVLFLIVVNGALALSEMAVVSSRLSRLQAMADKHVPGARMAVRLATDSGKFLSTVQIGITLVGVLSGAFSGATLGMRLSQWLQGFGLDDDLAETVGVGAVVLAITYATLIVGELVPKQIALRHPESVAARIAPAMVALARLTSPFVWLLDISGKAVLRLFGQSGARPETVTEEEIKTLAAEAESSGVLEPGEKDMIAGVLRLGERNVQVVMTPRTDVDMLDLSKGLDAMVQALGESPHSRLPVFDGAAQDILGVIRAKDLLQAVLCQGADVRPQDFVRHAPIIPDTADARDVLGVLKNAPIHMGLVHNEYGHFLGVVTTADILESIAGAFTRDDGPPDPDVVHRADGSLLLSGRMPIDEFCELTGLSCDGRAFHTVAGFVLDGFGRLPNTGETFHADDWHFEVVDMDGRRIDKVLASRTPG